MKTALTVISTLAATAIAAAFVPTAAGGDDGITLTSSQVAAQSEIAVTPDCLNRVRMAPVAIMTTAGPALAGPVTATTSIYSDGTVILSQFNAITGGSSVIRKQVPRAAVTNLQEDVLAFGALRQCDQPKRVADIPMTTLTVFTDGPTSIAHSVSYWLADGNLRFVEDRIVEFMNAQVLN